MSGRSDYERRFPMIENLKMTKILFTVALAIVLLNTINIFLGSPSWQFTRLFGLDTESNFPTWFSSIMLALAAFFAYQVSVISGPERGCRIWQVAALVLLFLSCDEVAMIHEYVGEFFAKHFFDFSQTSHSAWLLVLGVPTLVGAMFLVSRISLYIRSVKARLFLGAGLLFYITGVFLLESMLGLRIFPDLAKTTWLWIMEVIFEEGFEMAGVIMIIKGLQEQYKNEYKF